MAVDIEFDDLVYALQPFGGISEYWRQVTGRIAGDARFRVRRSSGRPWQRMSSPRSDAQVFHSSYFRVARGARARSVTTVHDMAFEMGRVGAGLAHALKTKLHCLEHKRAFFASDALVCVSQSTRDDLLAVYPALASRVVRVIHHGVSLAAPEAPAEAPGAPYLLFVGKRATYKNFDKALEALALSGLAAAGMKLRCTGHAFSDDERRRIGTLGLSGAVEAVGNVPDAQLAALYAGAHALVYPSLFEGFGLPVVEAMRMGCPVIAYAGSCIPEIAGDAALLVDTSNPHAIAAALARLDDAAFRAELVERGRRRAAAFSWDRCAEQHAELYRELAGQQPRGTA